MTCCPSHPMTASLRGSIAGGCSPRPPPTPLCICARAREKGGLQVKLLITSAPPACVPLRLIASFFSLPGCRLANSVIAGRRRTQPAKRQKPTAGTPAVPPKQTAVRLPHRIGRPRGMTPCGCGAGESWTVYRRPPVLSRSRPSPRDVQRSRRARLSLLFRLRQNGRRCAGKGYGRWLLGPSTVFFQALDRKPCDAMPSPCPALPSARRLLALFLQATQRH